MKSSEDLVSVILPTRNRAALLGRAIHSVLAQTHRNLELIVVNDASTDGTAELLAGFEDARLRVIDREHNQGAAAARNLAAAQAHGRWLAFQDDDDIWLVDKLRRQLAALQDGGRWCLGGYIQIRPGGARYIGGDFYLRELDFSRGIGEGGPDWHLIATPNWLLDRQLFERVGGFDERIRSWDDWELGLRLFDHCRPVHVNEALFIQDHVLGAGLMRAGEVRGADMRLILEKHEPRWASRRAVLARHYYVVGRAGTLYADVAGGRRWLLRSLRVNPFRLRSMMALVMSWAPTEFSRGLTRLYRRAREARS